MAGWVGRAVSLGADIWPPPSLSGLVLWGWGGVSPEQGLLAPLPSAHAGPFLHILQWK